MALLRRMNRLEKARNPRLAVLLRGAYRMETFGWEYYSGAFKHGRMRAGLAWWVLVSVMPALLVICFAKNLDYEPPVQPSLATASPDASNDLH